MSQFVGIDGCRAGWFAVMLKNAEEYDFEIFSNIEELWNSLSSAQDFLIDIPIGLKEKDEQGRRCDTEARERLKWPRSSSVFTPPSRCVLHMRSREKASEKSRRLTGRGISVQAWSIVPSIREVDEFLRETPPARKKLREIHPEVLFCALNGGKSMVHK
ncbi:MAG: DUF429 domain-containing protein, partial [Candidatus Hydrogenedentes bacterium]|nr:DUF429 domain-containing protein [Candidatus Hydrogenedentota bacterium]